MVTEFSTEGKKVWNQIVAKAWSDEAFKKRLLANPAAVLTEHGLQVSDNLRVVENTDQVHYLVLPSQEIEELSEADLEQVVAGNATIHVVCMAR